jgi:very-short-patch-repair endonuclease
MRAAGTDEIGRSQLAVPNARIASNGNSRVRGWELVARLAEDQNGVVTRSQLRDAGFSEAAVGRLVSASRIFPVFPTVFAVGHRGIGRSGRLLAAVLSCGEGTAVSHGTAAWLLGLWNARPGEIELIAPVEAGRKLSGVRRRFVPLPGADEIRVREGVPVTTPSRTLIDIAGFAGVHLLKSSIEQAAVLRALDIPEIDRILAESPRRRRGSKKLLTLLDDWRRYKPGITIRSRMEAKLLPLLTRRGLPIPECNSKLRLGGETFEIDFLWRKRRLAVEADGGQFHDNPAAAARDSHRNRALAQAGYFIPRLGWEDLRDRAEETMDEIARLLSISCSIQPLSER